MRGVKTGAVAFLLLVVLAGCGAMDYTRSLFVSGVSLEALGTQFVQVTEQVTAGCDAHTIPVTTCARYRTFGEGFKRAYPLTVSLWQAAEKAGDTATKRRAEDVARSLASDLSRLAVEALGTLAPEVK